MKGSFFAVLMLSLAGCGTRVDYMRTNSPPRELSARNPSEVEVFTSGRPERPFVEVGIIESQQQSMYSTDQPAKVFESLREEAARQGCDAIILLGSNDAFQAQTGQYGGSGKTLKGYRATCAVYKDPGPAEKAR
jgi:hypothetical protein